MTACGACGNGCEVVEIRAQIGMRPQARHRCMTCGASWLAPLVEGEAAVLAQFGLRSVAGRLHA